jgi:dipeptide/tripeptide permease
MPVIRDHYGYFVAFLFPAGLMAVAFLIFALGKPFYAVEVIERKKKTRQDYALMLQVLRRVAGVFLLVAFFWSIFDQSGSTWIFFGQTYQVDFELLGQRITPERIQFFNPVLIVILLPFVMYLWTALEKKGIKVKSTSKIMAGFLLTATCMAVMGLLGFKAGPLETLYVPLNAASKFEAQEQVQKALPGSFDAACVFGAGASPSSLPVLLSNAAAPQLGKEVYVRPENKVTLWWQALVYLILTVAEILISVTGLEMAFVVAPKSLKGFVTALWLLTVFLGNLLLNAPLGQLYPNTHPGYYFLMLAGMMVGVMIVFSFVAPRFNRLMEAVAIAEKAGKA